MTRKEGFIEVDKMLQEIGVDTKDFDTILCSPLVHIIKDDMKGVHFSFKYKGETYFYKQSFYIKGGSPIFINPYNELVAEELAKDFDIPCIDYDLAIIGSNKGVLSKNFTISDTNYISGKDILGESIEYYDSDLENNLVKKIVPSKNDLEDIWDKLEIYYQNDPNKTEIIRYLMKRIVDIYLFDIITCQIDRHQENWQIMESMDGIDIVPLYDNERILVSNGDHAFVNLGINITWINHENLWESIKQFQKMSSSEFTNIIKDKLWIISEENLYKLFDRIEQKTGYPMPEERKIFYFIYYQKHRKKLEEILGLTKEGEKQNERKNR